MTHRNSNALANVACPKCKQSDAFEVDVRARAVIIDNGAESYTDPMWEDDAGTKCTSCGYQGEWHEFNLKPYSVCTGCGATIYWHRVWVNDDGEPGCVDGLNHQPLWLTLGELRDRTAHLPDAMPITVLQAEPHGWYNNLHLEDVPETFDPAGGGEPSLILSQTDDMDSRQW